MYPNVEVFDIQMFNVKIYFRRRINFLLISEIK